MSAAYERLARAISSGGPTMHLRDDLIDVLRERDDLLAALEKLYAAVPDNDAGHIVEWKQVLWEGLGEACRDARAAIATARGGR